MPPDRRKLLPYVLALVPPFILQLYFSQLFFQALDVAGTYGVLVLFGVLPAAMTWQVNEARLISRCCLHYEQLHASAIWQTPATQVPCAAAVPCQHPVLRCRQCQRVRTVQAQLACSSLPDVTCAVQERYGDAELLSRTEVVPGGRLPIIAVGAVALAVIGNETVGSIQHLLHG